MRYLYILLTLSACTSLDEPTVIDRKAVFTRHLIRLHSPDTLSSLTVGNGRFAMTCDITGLQTFPEYYQNGIPLGTQSEWGWHSFPSAMNYRIVETLDSMQSHGRTVPYARQWPAGTRRGDAGNYLRQNPHRIHLGTWGWDLRDSLDQVYSLADIDGIDQSLDMWTGELRSQFAVQGNKVRVTTLGDQDEDRIHVEVKSGLLDKGWLGLRFRVPFPTNTWLDEGTNWVSDEASSLDILQVDPSNLVITRQLDSLRYFIQLTSSAPISYEKTEDGLLIHPDDQDVWSFSFSYSQERINLLFRPYEEIRNDQIEKFTSFWKVGGMLDFENVKDPRAHELERRMITSLYLTRVNCQGKTPPQETGLTYNSWYGKPHLEMAWWHGVHFALWGHPEVLKGYMSWYHRGRNTARNIAERQGFEGVRWQKMTDPWGGETVSSVGSYLIWQQPHPIYFAELLFQLDPSPAILEAYADLVEETAVFMAAYAWPHPDRDQYVLGPGLMPAQERFDPSTTQNPTFELAYWRWGLETAQQWRIRSGKERHPDWDEVLDHLSPLPVSDDVYLAASSAQDSYTNPRYMSDHPSVLATYGMLPMTPGLDTSIMRNTFDKIWSDWHWEDTWGWDFPMTAMTATRLGLKEKALEALLMPIETNTFLPNGHNYQDDRLRLYLPGNGGLLSTLALMATHDGFPDHWDVNQDGLHKIP